MQTGAKMTEKDCMELIDHNLEIYRRFSDGRQELIGKTHNVVTYRAADILAKIIGGDASYIPSRLGMIYAADTKAFLNPGTTRSQDWSAIANSVQGQAGNMILCTLASPTFGVLGETEFYSNNMVTISAMSDKDAPRAFSGSTYDAHPPASGKKYFQVVLLARTFVAGSSTPVYTPYAIAQLTDTTGGLAIEDNTEIVVYWSLAFK